MVAEGPGDGARRILDERLARGEITPQEHADRSAALAGSRRPGPGSPRPASGWRGPARWLAITLAAVALIAGGWLAAAATAGFGPWRTPQRPAGFASGTGHGACQIPALPGKRVNVTLTDHGRGWMRGSPQQTGGMMGGGMPGGGMPGGSPYHGSPYHGHMMAVLTSPASVPAGIVSLRVRNVGTLTHELVVLPLPAGQPAGSRVVGPDGTVSEAGSLGEASATCRGGHGDGIAPGAAGWVSLTLRPGRYELVCNIPGHYARGMYAELDVR